MRSNILKASKKLHNGLLWVSLIALLAFVLSALTHPLMVWTGPQAKTFMPPQMQLSSAQIEKIPAILSSSDIKYSLVSKVLPTEHGPMLQLTTNISEPRRYFSFAKQASKQSLNYDKAQAIWLARYYTGEKSPIKNISLMTDFSEEYPPVNRLLPVYRVDFDNNENLTAYIYTETNTLAGLNNNWKRSLQTVFQALHTWSWLDGFPVLRILLSAFLLLTLLLMSLSGLAFLILIKRKKAVNLSRRLHRKLAWFVLIPFIAFIVSGIYHLFQSEYGEKSKGMHLSKAIDVQHIAIGSGEFTAVSDKFLNSFSLIEHNGKRYFRASISGLDKHIQKPHSHHQGSSIKQRNKRFDGIGREKTAFYIAIDSVEETTLTDEVVAEKLAVNHLSLNKDLLASSEKITRFGKGYDFRNKRLPVWMFEFNTVDKDRLYIDPITGILVEHTIDTQRYEGLSFSLLHKWNFLLAFASREQRDGAIILTLFIFLILGGFGLSLYWSRKNK